MKNSITSGKYMKVTQVRLFLAKFNPIQAMEANKLTKHECEFDVYFSTSDLKSIIKPDLFKKLECECVEFTYTSQSTQN